MSGQGHLPRPTLIAHSAGGEPWQLTPYSTSPAAMFTDLAGVHAISSADVWGVGSDEVPSRTHIAHNDGTTWQPVASPGDADSSGLSAVAAGGRDDAFAVGARRPSGPQFPALPPLAVWTPSPSAGIAHGGRPCPAPALIFDLVRSDALARNASRDLI
jgi:hypothetical protein